MEFQIKFDAAGNPIVPTLVLMHRGGKKIGAIEPYNFKLQNSTVEAPTLSFQVYKMRNGVKDPMWDYITNFRVLWCKEWNRLFEIYVETNEGDDTVKSVSATDLAHAELSQVLLHDIEINTENDILRDDYKAPTILFDNFSEETRKNSLLHRITVDKLPYWNFVHVDASIAKIQRTFTFDGVSVMDAFKTIGEEIGAYFDVSAYLDANGNIQRDISVYDTYYVCENCGHRNKYITDTCEKCQSHHIKWGFGQDTSIFVQPDELGEDIKFITDTGSVKNCFKLEAGDDLMTATVRNINPNGSDYIWYFSEETFEDMSPELATRLRQYQRDYEDWKSKITINVDAARIAEYNRLYNKYKDYPDTYDPKTGQWVSRLQPIATPIVGYEQLMEAWYKALDLGTFIKSELLPSATIGTDVTATTEMQKLTKGAIEPIAVAGNSVSITTADQAVLAKARSLINPNYKVEVENSSVSGSTWTGRLKVTSYSVIKMNLSTQTWGTADGVDIDGTTQATTGTLSIRISKGAEETEAYMQSRIENALKKRNDQLSTTTKVYENITIVGLFNRGLNYNTSAKTFSDTGCVPSYTRVTSGGIVSEIGQYGKGNIDLWNRPQYRYPDGSIATVESIGIYDESLGKEVLIPTIVSKNGVATSLSDDEAIAWYERTGQYLGRFDTVREEDEYAELLHEAQALYYIGEISGFTGSFVDQLKYYSLDYLKSLYECATAALNILIEQGVTEDEMTTWGDKPYGDIYSDMYLPYFYRCQALEQEIAVREQEVNAILGVKDEDGNYTELGLVGLISAHQDAIRQMLDIRTYLGDKLWIEMSSYRREDKYSNSNFISEGLMEDELFQNAREFFDYAEKEIYKSANLQHSIDTNLKNLIMIDKFKPLVDSFALGNWIRVKVDDRVYRLRLISYEIDFDNLSNVNVSFSDVFKVAGGISDIQDLMSKISSVATSYDSTAYQSEKGYSGKRILDGWSSRGLDVTNQRLIQGAEDQTQTWDSNGMLFRQYDSVSEDYDDKQLKIVNSTLAITDDNWKTIKTAVGRFYYYDPVTNKLKEAYGVNGDTIVGRLILGEQLGIYNSTGSMTFDSEDGLKIQNAAKTHTVQIDPNNSGGLFRVANATQDLLWLDAQGQLHIRGDGRALDITANDSVTGLQSSITQTADTINLRIDDLDDDVTTELNMINGKAVLRVNKQTGRLAEVRLDGTGEETSVSIQAEDINISGRTINLTSETLSIESTYFGVTAWGYLRAESGTIGGLTINQNNIQQTGSYGGLTINNDGQIFATGDGSSESRIYGGVINTIKTVDNVTHLGQLTPGSLQIVGSVGSFSFDATTGVCNAPSGEILTAGNYTKYVTDCSADVSNLYTLVTDAANYGATAQSRADDAYSRADAAHDAINNSVLPLISDLSTRISNLGG